MHFSCIVCKQDNKSYTVKKVLLFFVTSLTIRCQSSTVMLMKRQHVKTAIHSIAKIATTVVAFITVM